MLRKIEMDTKFLKASKLYRTANYQEASALYQELITEIRKQDQIEPATQKRLAHYMLQNIECLKQSRHIPFSEFQEILTSTQKYLKEQMNQSETNEHGLIDSIVAEYSEPQNQEKYIELSASHLKTEISIPAPKSEVVSQNNVVLDAPLVLDIPPVPDATSNALPPLLNSKGFPMISGLRLPSKVVKPSDSENKLPNNNKNKSKNHYDSIETVMQNNYVKDKPTIYKSMPEHVLPIPVSSVNMDEPQESHTLIQPESHTKQKPRLFIDDFEDKRTPSEDGLQQVKITRLQTMLDLTDHLLHQLKSDTISESGSGQRTILLPFARELQNLRTLKALKDSMLETSRLIYHADANNKEDLIKHLEKLKSVLETIKNGPAPKPVSTPSRASTRKRKEPTPDQATSSSSAGEDSESEAEIIELQQDDSEELEDKVPFTPSFKGLRNSGFFSAKGKKAKTLLDHRDAALKAIRLGEADKLAELIGTDGLYASKLIPGNSGNTYLMYALQFNNNVENIVTTLLPASVLHAKNFGQLFCPSNVNANNESSAQIAIKHGNLDALKNGIAISAAIARKNTEGLFRIVDEQIQSAMQPKSSLHPY